MEQKDKKTTFKRKGVSVTAFLSPSLVILLALHIAVFGFIIRVNNLSSTLSSLMQRSNVYVSNATSLLAGSSVLSDTATNYVLKPMLEDDIPNAGPIVAYGNELKLPRRGKDVLKEFEGTDAPADAVAKLQEAAESADYLLDCQLHAIAIISDVHPLPNVPSIWAITPLLPVLTEEEKNLADDKKADLAVEIILSKKYSESKGNVSSCVNTAVSMIQLVSGDKASQTASQLNIIRTLLWVSAAGIALLIFFIFFMLYKELFLPVLRSSKLIENDKELQEKQGFREMRLLSESYNGLKARRDALDQALHIAAEKDALTGLSNRYAYDHTLNELTKLDKEHDTSIAFILCDVNYLKDTNDSKGHAAGDALLKEASYCIEQSFRGGKCFRIGGDEFACLLTGISKETVENMIQRFIEMQAEKKISVSYGYAYHPSVIEGDVEVLMKKADAEMYACKEEMHKNHK